MQVNVSVGDIMANRRLATVTLNHQELGTSSVLDMNLSSIEHYLADDRSAAVDMLLIASVVYAVDKMILRDGMPDRWTREFHVSFPVYNPALWAGAREQLQDCLSFLTGDQWICDFVQLDSPLCRPNREHLQVRIPLQGAAEAVCLFSGGLDSLIGAINWLESAEAGSLCLVGHHDGGVPGPLSDQKRVLPSLDGAYPVRTTFLPIRVGQNPPGREITYRSRSIVFIALGIYVAQKLGGGTPLLLPENGTIALNPPLLPSRRGSCSTRTAHPLYLALLRQVLDQVGIDNPVLNPLEMRTKGEVVAECRNQGLLREVALRSVSCAKRGRKQYWDDTHARACGFCMPCIYRRAALHTVGLDVEGYGIDITQRGATNGNPGFQKDFRAYCAFLRRIRNNDQIAKELIANGSLDLARLPEYVGIVSRARDEVRAWLRDRGTDDVKRLAGL